MSNTERRLQLTGSVAGYLRGNIRGTSEAFKSKGREVRNIVIRNWVMKGRSRIGGVLKHFALAIANLFKEACTMSRGNYTGYFLL
jgi:hypothetical protein